MSKIFPYGEKEITYLKSVDTVLPLSAIPNTGVLSLKERLCEFLTFLFQWRFLFLPPTNVSSASTLLLNFPLFRKILQPLIRCCIYHVDF